MPRVLVANALDGSVVFFDATTRKKLKTLKVGASPQGIAVARNGKFGYVTNAGDDTITVVDVIRMSETGTLKPDDLHEAGGISVLPDGRSLLVLAAREGQAAVLDGTSGTQRARIDLGGPVAEHFAVAPSGERAWFADPAQGRVFGVDLRSGQITVAHDIEGGPSSVALARDNRTLLVTVREPARLVRMDPDDGRVTGAAEVGSNPVLVCAHPYADAAFVVAKGSGSVFTVDLNTMQSDRPIAVGLGPVSMAVARAGKTLYVANSESDNLSVVDVPKRNVPHTWDTGHRPCAVSFLS